MLSCVADARRGAAGEAVDLAALLVVSRWVKSHWMTAQPCPRSLALGWLEPL